MGLRAYRKHVLPWLSCLGVGLVLVDAGAEDRKLKEGEETPRYPHYTYEDEVPRRTMTVPGSSSGTFFERHAYGDLFLGRWQPDYLNYGFKDYKNYRLNTTPNLRNYDIFGNFIADGYEIFTLEEFRTREPQVGSLGHKGQFYQNWLHHLIIADDAYGGWNTRLTVGDFIHTTFTPLTLDMVDFNGIRFDAISTTDKKLTLVVSRISDPLKMRSNQTIFEAFRTDLGRSGKRGNVNDGVYLLGGHWETNISELFVLGATYVNLNSFDSQRGFRTDGRKGLVPQNTVPREIIVRFQDDSPEDGRGGAAVFDIVARVTLAPPVDAPDEQETVVELRPSSEETSAGVVQRSRHLEASGFFRDAAGIDTPVFIDYTFEVPENAVDVEFSALVANDYMISMRQNHFRFTDPVRGSGENRESEFAIIRRAEHNIVDASNKRRIRFDYGLATGVEVMGLNGKLALPGLEVHGEIVKSNNYYQYPTLLGKRSKFDDVAGYLTIDKEWSHFSVGAEGFSIGPKFTSYNPHPSDPQAPLGEAFFFNEPRQSFHRNVGVLTSTPFYPLVDDNDNMLYDETPDSWLDLGRPREVSQGRTGIFPFFDLDQDGFQDTNRNRNEFADYEEPFLMYFTDPEEFYFGDDFNNNFITDAWEDDNLPNYPYYKDERGLHLRAGFRPVQNLRLTAGRYKVKQIAAAGRNEVVYGRLNLDWRFFSQWRVRWEHESKNVEDDIPNDYSRYLLQEGISPVTHIGTFFEDRLEARDSFINRGLLRIGCRPAEHWNVEGKFRYELNHQGQRSFETGVTQSQDDLNFYGAVFRTGYTYRQGNLEVKPRFKMLYRFRGRESLEEPTAKNLQLLPILRADYRLTERSQLRLGMQGFPGVVDRRRDFVNKANDSEWMTWTLMWFLESEYEGYRIGTEVGVTRQEIDFDEPERPAAQFNRFFIRMVSGVGAVVR